MKTARQGEKLEYLFETVDSGPSTLVEKQIEATATMIERWLVSKREVIVNGTQRIA